MSKKSNMPEFKEVIGFAGKFMRDIKTSVSEIIDEYQQSRKQPGATKDAKPAAESKPPAPKKTVETNANKKTTSDAVSKTKSTKKSGDK